MAHEQPSLTVEKLEAAGLEGEFDAVESAVENHLDGGVANIAVVSEPFAGREVFLDYAEQEFGAATGRMRFDEFVTGELPEFPNAEIVLVDNCQYLYQREIGGFDMLKRFLDHIGTREALYVTSWNRYAWAYLTAVTDVDVAFPETIQIPRLDASQVGNLLRAHHGTPLPMFEEAQGTGRMKTLDLDWQRLQIGNRGLPVPMPEFNTEYVFSRFRTDAEVDVEAVVYQRIAQLSEGDPGVATIIWDESVRDDTISPSYLASVDQPIVTSPEEAFLLEVVLTNESIAFEHLAEVCDDIAVQQALQRLITQGVVTLDDQNAVHIEPTRLYSTVEHLTRRQLVW